MKIPIRLQPQPQLRRGLQEAAKSERSIRGDAPFPEDDLVETVQRDVESTRRFDLTDPERLQILLEQHLAGGNRRTQPVRIPSDSLRPRLRRHVRFPA